MNIRTRTRLTLAILLASMAYAPVVSAQGSTGTKFDVQAEVPGVCSVSASNLEFGAFVGAEINTSTKINVKCVNGQHFEVLLDDGNHLAPNGTRQMEFGRGNFLRYDLYTDKPGGSRWGNARGLGVTGIGLGLPQGQDIFVYGRLFGSAFNQSAPAGVYSDTINVTVLYM